ncbi:MAG: energy-coupling factor ABC transporter ATP-binding protein, partial [Acutalibacteraceae bacterium]
MAQIEIKNLSFKYPLGKTDALKNISLTVKDGEYIVLCGKSGCGKTTLLRQIKSVLAPKGKKSGSVMIDGVEAESLGVTEQAQKIGFVMQDPENQIVTDKVWHELAFGLENIGLERDEIRLRTAEMASYFGIGSWFERDVSTLSGGQKQLLNLAAVMAMRPEVLILDEPTSQLDPVAADS